MKVAHVITRLIIGGAQENTLLTVEGQHHRHGDAVTLITGPGIGPEGSLEERAKKGGLDLRVIPALRRSIHPLRDLASYRQLVQLLRELKPDVVHTHSSKAGVLGRAAAAKLGIPAVHTIHGAAFHYGQNPLLHWSYILAEQWAAPRTNKFISVCDAMTDQYVAAGIAPRDRFVTIYSGIEVEPFLNPPRRREDVRAELGLKPTGRRRLREGGASLSSQGARVCDRSGPARLRGESASAIPLHRRRNLAREISRGH
jgi:glycosyltransferase involved in cell wall biosynthesis